MNGCNQSSFIGRAAARFPLVLRCMWQADFLFCNVEIVHAAFLPFLARSRSRLAYMPDVKGLCCLVSDQSAERGVTRRVRWKGKAKKTHSSNCRATRYMKKICAVKKTPATLPLYNAVPKKLKVLPQYIGAPVTLKGKPSTFLSIRIPK